MRKLILLIVISIFASCNNLTFKTKDGSIRNIPEYIVLDKQESILTTSTRNNYDFYFGDILIVSTDTLINYDLASLCIAIMIVEDIGQPYFYSRIESYDMNTGRIKMIDSIFNTGYLGSADMSDNYKNWQEIISIDDFQLAVFLKEQN